MLAPLGSQAGSDLNEVGAFLAFPAVIALNEDLAAWETFLSVTNASGSPAVAHVAYINGDEEADDYCFECSFDVALTGNDTETLVVTQTPWGITIVSEDRTVAHSCPHPFGMILVSLEDAQGNVRTDNVLLGSLVIVNYSSGFSYSMPAIPFQGKNASNGDRNYGFDDFEYGKLPRIVATDFIAPDLVSGQISGHLALFTLGFDRQFPPLVDCSVTGYDAAENAFSRSIRFGCWVLADLCDVHPEFCYPNLSGTPCTPGPADDPNEPEVECDTHGWLKLNCRVDQNGDGVFEAMGGVHGALIQTAGVGAIIRRNEHQPRALAGAVSWSRLLYQSVTGGGAVSLQLEPQAGWLD